MSHDWPIKSLGEIFAIARGGSPRPIDAFLTEDVDGVNWIMIGDAAEGSKYIRTTRKRIRKEGVSRSRMVQPGDFLLTNSMSFGRPYIVDTSGCVHDGWLVLSPRSDDVSRDFFYHLLGSDLLYSEFARKAAGVTVKNLNIEIVRGVEVPLPPLAEQRRIAEVLDRAEALRAKRRAALAQLDYLTQSLFLDMFGDPVANPRGLTVRPLGELAENKDSVRVPVKQSDRDQRAGQYPYYGSVGIIDDIDDYLFEGSHLLISEDGKHLESRNRPVACLADGRFWVNNHAHVLAFNGEAELIFLAYTLELRSLSQYVTGIDQFKLNRKTMDIIPVPLPTIELQREFARRVTAVERLKTAHRASLAELDALFASLQHRAFRGEL